MIKFLAQELAQALLPYLIDELKELLTKKNKDGQNAENTPNVDLGRRDNHTDTPPATAVR